MASPYRADAVQSIAAEERDYFGHRDHATAIVAAIADVPSPFTLGLFGPWGSGKSTILEEVGRRLRKDKALGAAFASFDVWRYEGDSLRREFIRDIGRQLRDDGKLDKKFKLQEHT